jgi:hypothetical protein
MDRYDMYVFGVVPMSINPVGLGRLRLSLSLSMLFLGPGR